MRAFDANPLAAARWVISSIAKGANAGVVGAGFPTHVKLAAQADTVLINAAECEPLLHKNKVILQEFTTRL